MDTKKEVQKLESEELKSVTGGAGLKEVPGMKRFPKLHRKNPKLLGRIKRT